VEISPFKIFDMRGRSVVGRRQYDRQRLTKPLILKSFNGEEEYIDDLSIYILTLMSYTPLCYGRNVAKRSKNSGRAELRFAESRVKD